MSGEIRPWLVAALARTNPAAGLDGPAAELWYHATEAERAAVAQLHGLEAIRLLQEAGRSSATAASWTCAWPTSTGSSAAREP
jgi:hypothetical protein